MDNLAFTDSDCDLFGQDDVSIGIRLCLRMNPSAPGVLMTGTLAGKEIRRVMSLYMKHRNFRLSEGDCTGSMLG